MKAEELTSEQIAALVDRIERNHVLNTLFNRLFAIYGAPKWLTEIKPFQNPEFLIEEWEKAVAKYDEADIMEAANRLFRYNKLRSFPTAAHILAEMPEDTPSVKHEREKTVYIRPAELVPVWDEAVIFGVTLGRFLSVNEEINKKGWEVRNRMQFSVINECKTEMEQKQSEYLLNDPYLADLYRDDEIALFVACYKRGVFNDVIEKIKKNIAGEYVVKPKREEKKTTYFTDTVSAFGF